jgi:glycine cleavage system H protein
MKNPDDILYTKEHEWIRISGNTGTIGITDFAQHELGDVVYVELPKTGDVLKAAQTLGTIESVKAVSEIFSPVSGEILEVNTDLGNAPEIINADPYGNGWLVKMKLKDPAETAGLMSKEQYEVHIAEE